MSSRGVSWGALRAAAPGVTKGVQKKKEKRRKEREREKKEGKKGKKKRKERQGREKFIETSINMRRGVPLVYV